MKNNYATEFLTPFPATHIFKLCQVKDGTRKDLCKYTTYAMEAFIAVWLESKIGDVSHFSGHFLNVDTCGYRYFLGPHGAENSTYVSYEIQPDGTYKPLVVHSTWKHVHKTYGDMTSSPQGMYDYYVAHPRFETVFLRRFATYHDTNEIQCLFDDAREATGDTHAKELRQMADLKKTRGLYVSKSGKLPDTGGIKGTDYEEYQSVSQAVKGSNGLLPGAIRQDGLVQCYTYSFIAELIDAGNDRKITFVSKVKGGNVIQSGAHKGKAGYVVQFSPFLFTLGNGGGEPAKYQYFTG
jgi:hypothetical protein